MRLPLREGYPKMIFKPSSFGTLLFLTSAVFVVFSEADPAGLVIQQQPGGKSPSLRIIIRPTRQAPVDPLAIPPIPTPDQVRYLGHWRDPKLPEMKNMRLFEEEDDADDRDADLDRDLEDSYERSRNETDNSRASDGLTKSSFGRIEKAAGKDTHNKTSSSEKVAKHNAAAIIVHKGEGSSSPTSKSTHHSKTTSMNLTDGSGRQWENPEPNPEARLDG